jgi:hypothetical protein
VSGYGLDAPSTGVTPQGQRPNKFPGWCVKCRQPVPVGEGTIHKDPATGKWKTTHVVCPVPVQAAAPSESEAMLVPTAVITPGDLVEAIHAVRHKKKGAVNDACGCKELATKVWSHFGGTK